MSENAAAIFISGMAVGVYIGAFLPKAINAICRWREKPHA
jgi:F0F1-type ATP synthase assembly protein I